MIHVNLRSKSRSPNPFRSVWAITASAFLVALLVGSLSRAELNLIDGDSVKSGQHTAVFGITMGVTTAATPDGPNENLCTAFLVAPKLLLTAAHCVQNIQGITKVTNGNSIEDFTSYGVESYRARPGYVTTNSKNTDEANWQSGSLDIGYVVLTQEARGITPLEIYPTDSDEARASFVQSNATFVGYGANQWQSSGNYANAGSGTKRSAEKTVTSAEHGLIYLSGEKGGVLPGDSGGPMMMTIDGKTKVVAINHKMSDATRLKKNRRFLFFKLKDLLIRDHYAASIESPLTLNNLCWVESDSKVKIPGIDCAALGGGASP